MDLTRIYAASRGKAISPACSVLLALIPGQPGTAEARVGCEVQPKMFRQHLQKFALRGDHRGVCFAVRSAYGEGTIEHGEPAIRARTSRHEVRFEVRVGMGTRKPVAEFAVDRRHLFQSELADVVPLASEG